MRPTAPSASKGEGLADGIVVTPSHNPPTDGGFKYDPVTGGPAPAETTNAIAARANELLGDFKSIKRVPYEEAIKSEYVEGFDFREHYVADLGNVIDFDVIRDSGVRLGIDPLGGASVNYWPLINEKYGLNIGVVRPEVDPTWRFMTIDHDGKIRMDPSSPYAMKGLVDQLNAGAWDKYDLVGGTDPDADRHGIVCPNWGVMNPNHYIAVCVEYLFGGNRPGWPEGTGIGKTLVSSSLIDRVASSINAKLVEVPVGFKWFVDPLFSGEVAFGGEESSGMSFLRKDGRVWTTDKDGLIPDLLAAEITAKTGKNPAQLHQDQVARFGESWYKRVDTPTTLEQKAKFAKLTGDDVTATQLAGEDITAKLTEAPGNHAKIGGLKVTTKDNWFAARPPAPRTSTRCTPNPSSPPRPWTRCSTRPSSSSTRHWANEIHATHGRAGGPLATKRPTPRPFADQLPRRAFALHPWAVWMNAVTEPTSDVDNHVDKSDSRFAPPTASDMMTVS